MMIDEEMIMRNSNRYVATVYDLKDPLIVEQKRVARILNAKRKVFELQGLAKVVTYNDRNYVERSRVVVRPRLGKNNIHAHLYRVGGPLHRYTAQTIRPEHGTRFDVYLTYSLVERKKV
jgi:hypothetical protein